MTPADGSTRQNLESAPRVADVVRDVIARIAPAELPLIDGLRTFDDDRAVHLLARSRLRREPLGFGVDELALLLTPVVWIAVDEVVRRAIGATADGVGRKIARLARRISRRRIPPRRVPPLTPEQLAEVRRRVLELAARSGVAPEQAAVLADLVVARLATGSAPEVSGGGDEDATPAGSA